MGFNNWVDIFWLQKPKHFWVTETQNIFGHSNPKSIHYNKYDIYIIYRLFGDDQRKINSLKIQILLVKTIKNEKK